MLRGWPQSLFLLLALGCSASLSQLPKPHPGLKALMFYTCVTKEVENQCEESFTLDQNESANMGFTANFTTIRQGYEAGIRSLFAVHDIFFNNSNHSLKANWRATWEDTKSKLTPYILGNQVAGFFIGDELFPGKIPLDDFLTVLKVVDDFRDQFPQKALLIWENEGGTNWVSYVKKELGGSLPEELDVFSIDDYSMDVKQHKQFHENIIYPMLSPHQKVFLVPGSYATRAPENISKSIWCCHGSKFSDCDSCIAERVEGFYAWAATDERVVGFAPWHWDSRTVPEVTEYKEVGTIDMPKTRKLWIDISRAMNRI